MRRLLLLIAAVTLIGDIAASSPRTGPQEKSRKSATVTVTPSAQLDACSLITDKEVESVQGNSLTSKTPSQRSDKGLTVSQCYFLLGKPEDSIVLQMMIGQNPDNPQQVNEFWEEMFRVEGDKEGNGSRKEHESLPAPQKIEALGDEAFWTSQRFGGILHVLKGNSYFSVSIGGSGDPSDKLQKSKKLAEIVLKRL